MTNALTAICADKHDHVARQKAICSLEQLADRAAAQSAPRGFASALKRAVNQGGYGLITEIKKASPSGGMIRADGFDPPALAKAYAAGGAACLSVLTDAPYFQGADEYLGLARDAVDLPALRKDFMVDPYQIVESRAIGADCVLLIMAVLTDTEASEMEQIATSLGMDVLIEIHDEEELARALLLKSPLMGINNRNLKTLKTDLGTTKRLGALVPADRLLVSESGLHSPEDLRSMEQAGAHCFLIGEALMRQPDVEAATRHILGRSRAPTE